MVSLCVYKCVCVNIVSSFLDHEPTENVQTTPRPCYLETVFGWCTFQILIITSIWYAHKVIWKKKQVAKLTSSKADDSYMHEGEIKAIN